MDRQVRLRAQSIHIPRRIRWSRKHRLFPFQRFQIYQDRVFRAVFGDPRRSRPVTALLNALLALPTCGMIQYVTFRNSAKTIRSTRDKASILDIWAMDENGRSFNIEMQLPPFGGFRERSLYYLTTVHSEQLKTGTDYMELRPTIGIYFIRGKLEGREKINDYHRIYELRERTHHDLYSNHLEVHLIELGRFRKSLQELTTPEEKWIYWIQYGARLSKDDVGRMFMPEITEAHQRFRELTDSDERRLWRIRRRIAELDRLSAARAAERAEKSLAETENVLNETKKNLNITKNDLNKACDDLNKTQNDLNKTQNDLNKTQNDLNKTQNDLNKTQNDLSVTSGQLSERETQLNVARTSLRQAIVLLASARFGDISPERSAQIEQETDVQTLDQWLKRTGTMNQHEWKNTAFFS